MKIKPYTHITTIKTNENPLSNTLYNLYNYRVLFYIYDKNNKDLIRKINSINIFR